MYVMALTLIPATGGGVKSPQSGFCITRTSIGLQSFTFYGPTVYGTVCHSALGDSDLSLNMLGLADENLCVRTIDIYTVDTVLPVHVGMKKPPLNLPLKMAEWRKLRLMHLYHCIAGLCTVGLCLWT